ncbi:MAG: 4-(cytidine 5'-diphospho)-2-C-methyl-D-erythritol kinase [Bacteroidetes bacterium]|nr:4-(cytidine 5'-diphospho)-2-C-methyl-D-erythritol kinase [Bacteroidota bacterium]
MVNFPNCKINLGLNIIQKRPDGYHDLETVFYPISIKDILEIITDPNASESGNIIYTASGIPVDGELSNNLCCKAYLLLKKDFPQLPSIKMHLHKNIPMGAGLGGGSADAAFTLTLLNQKYQLGLDQKQLIDYALQLGSDCPFFILNKPSLGRGRGEQLTELELDLSQYQFLIVNPGIHISTAWAFSQINPSKALYPIDETIFIPIGQWKSMLVNDFEAPVVKAYPEIGTIIHQLYANGAVYASLSGSGSTVYGIFPKGTVLPAIFPKHYFIAVID